MIVRRWVAGVGMGLTSWHRGRPTLDEVTELAGRGINGERRAVFLARRGDGTPYVVHAVVDATLDGGVRFDRPVPAWTPDAPSCRYLRGVRVDDAWEFMPMTPHHDAGRQWEPVRDVERLTAEVVASLLAEQGVTHVGHLRALLTLPAAVRSWRGAESEMGLLNAALGDLDKPRPDLTKRDATEAECERTSSVVEAMLSRIPAGCGQ